MPLPNTHLIHPSFEAHHRPVADKQMTATCRIDRPQGPPVFNEVTAVSAAPPPTVVYTGPCRVQRSPLTATAGTVADRSVTEARYRVVVSASAPPVKVGDLVTVTASPNDPQLLGILRVIDVPRGSVLWQRDLLCDFHQPAT